MAKRKHKGIPAGIVGLLCILGIAGSGAYTVHSYLSYKYNSPAHPNFSEDSLRQLDPSSLEYKLTASVIGTERMNAVLNPVTEEKPEEIVTEISSDDPDKNQDGIIIEHIYGGTYEGYMMVVQNPEDVVIEINPTGGAGPALDWYVEHYNAAGGINGGGFEDEGGRGDGSIPQGLVIQGGKIVHGSESMRASIVGITKDHKLITTTTTGAEALEMGIQEAVTFGPTFIENGKVVYTSADAGTLNMLNPRTAIGQKADGTFLLLVIDGRGPSSWGAQYEDVIEIFQRYDAVMAGNLDGGNSSVMIYNGQYVHYPVSMYNSRNLPSVILVKEGN